MAVASVSGLAGGVAGGFASAGAGGLAGGGVAEVLASRCVPGDVVEAGAQMAELESAARLVDAARIGLLGEVERAGLHYEDGHASAKVMMRHVVRLSGGEAAARERCRRMFGDLDVIAGSYRSAERGGIGTDQVRLLGRVWANVRVRDAMGDRQEWFIELAQRLPYPRFEAKVRRWESLTDQDGAVPPNDRTYEGRNAQMVQNHFDLSWDQQGRFAALDGAAINDVFKAYVQAEWQIDWAQARAKFGDAATTANLARTDAQRRADAVKQVYADAAANPDGSMPAGFVHSIVWSASAYEEMASRFDGNPARRLDVDDFRCETIDGDPLEPHEAFANSMINHIRRVIVDARSVTIDLGQARSFRGNAKDAVRLNLDECFWFGCWVHASMCETDHLHEHAKGGRTHPGNGAPGCGRHNRWKQKGYRVWRDNTGQIHITRPDGTEINP